MGWAQVTNIFLGRVWLGRMWVHAGANMFKNGSYGAEEAFKILAAAFELVGSAPHRRMYDLENLHRTNAMVSSPCRADAAMPTCAQRELKEMLARLREKMEEVRSTMVCDCGHKHRRFVTGREPSAARFCRRCRTRHAVQNVGTLSAPHRVTGSSILFTCLRATSGPRVAALVSSGTTSPAWTPPSLTSPSGPAATRTTCSTFALTTTSFATGSARVPARPRLSARSSGRLPLFSPPTVMLPTQVVQ